MSRLLSNSINLLKKAGDLQVIITLVTILLTINFATRISIEIGSNLLFAIISAFVGIASIAAKSIQWWNMRSNKLNYSLYTNSIKTDKEYLDVLSSTLESVNRIEKKTKEKDIRFNPVTMIIYALHIKKVLYVSTKNDKLDPDKSNQKTN